MKRYDSAALKKWNRDVERDSVPLSENFRNLMDDSVMFASVSKIEESWIDLHNNPYDEEKHDHDQDGIMDELLAVCADEQAREDDDHLSASLTTILQRRHTVQHADSKVTFTELSDSSSIELSIRGRKRSRSHQNSNHPITLSDGISVQSVVIIGIFVTVSFSLGYAMGSKRVRLG